MTSQPSPLGRYGDTDPPPGQGSHEIRLLNVPVRVLADGRQQHDELMHEFSVLAVSRNDERASVPRRLVQLVEVLGQRYGSAASRPDTVIDEAIQRGQRSIDLTYTVPASVVDAADRLEELLAEADVFCRQEQMLTLPRTPLQVDFAHWYLEEFRGQIAGRAPEPWTGPLEP